MKLLTNARDKTKKFKRFTGNGLDMFIGREVMDEYEA
jgi:hypothetical protein